MAGKKKGKATQEVLWTHWIDSNI